MIISSQIKYLILLSHFPKFGPKRLRVLLNYFKNTKDAYFANLKNFVASGINEKIAYEFLAFRKQQDWEKLLYIIQKENINISTPDDDIYPPLLKEIFDPPVIIYYKGKLDLRESFPIAIVGTRKISEYGKRVTEEMSFGLAQQGFSIISGLALGTDSLAHVGALKAKAYTIAVLGTGIDSQNIYPSSNRFLAQKILDNDGALVSEFPLFTPPLRYNFPNETGLFPA
jgi:DNA processing protein